MEETKRKSKQLLMAVFFIIILVFGWQYPILGYFIPLCMLLGLGIGLSRGRKWCDWYCPRGSFYDSLISVMSPKKKIPDFLKNMIFRMGVLSFFMLIMTYNLVKRWPDPYKIGMLFVTLLTITTALGIILAFLFHPRSWCSFCPIGSVTNLLGRRKTQLEINSKLCTECKLCYKICPMQIAAYKYKKDQVELVRNADCLRCGLCIKVCPQKALRLK
jgi:polyferredoxin